MVPLRATTPLPISRTLCVILVSRAPATAPAVDRMAALSAFNLPLEATVPATILESRREQPPHSVEQPASEYYAEYEVPEVAKELAHIAISRLPSQGDCRCCEDIVCLGPSYPNLHPKDVSPESTHVQVVI